MIRFLYLIKLTITLITCHLQIWFVQTFGESQIFIDYINKICHQYCHQYCHQNLSSIKLITINILFFYKNYKLFVWKHENNKENK